MSNRIVAPKVHVEVFRPTHIQDRGETTGEVTGIKPNPEGIPNELRYIRQTNIQDRRVKGIQFEETALFGGFIEINIAEDPASPLFDRFNPNDHVEVFYDDSNKTSKIGDFLTSIGSSEEYNFMDSVPKFQGASWKSELKYTPSMVTTQLHAWDYLRLLQYINIPRGEREKSRATVIDSPPSKKAQDKLYAKTQKIKYQDDFLDYIDQAFNSFTDSAGTVTIFGQELLTVESATREGGAITKALKFVKTRKLKKAESAEDRQPIVTFYKGAIGNHIKTELDSSKPFKSFADIPNWNPNLENPEEFANEIGKALDKMEQYDIFQFRFIDGRFSRFTGTKGAEDYEGSSTHYVADIIAISQFSLIELLLKKLTIDHGLNQWFTPLVKFDSEFLKEIKALGTAVGKQVSKLVYIRLRKKETDGNDSKESTILAFNTDTYNLAAKFATDAFKLTIGNIVKTMKGDQSEADVDIFSEIISNIDFPQPKPVAPHAIDGKFSLAPLVAKMVADPRNESFRSGDKFYEDLMNRFVTNFQTDATFENKSTPIFYLALTERVTRWASFMQSVLSKDDKIISYIKSVPASYQRADIYTGSKFNTIQYDSLAITRMIQLIASNMAGFPATNNPKSNITVTKGLSPEKGRIDSYPIFAANRIVIRPRVFFGEETADSKTSSQYKLYNLYPSLAKMAKEKDKDQVNATCFVILEVAKKKMKAEGKDPEFIFPIEDIRDFGMIKASTVNHFFNFTIADQFQDFNILEDLEGDDEERFYNNITTNGIFLEYREGDLSSVGFSPPEHQQLKLEDLTQSSDYSSWLNRFSSNTNIRSTITGQPIFNPRTAWISREADAGRTVADNFYMFNNFNKWDEPFEIERVPLEDDDQKSIFYKIVNGSRTDTLSILEDITRPYQGITGFADISDLKAEFKALELILTSDDIQYLDISNLEQSLMDNIWIRRPLTFTYDKNATTYEDRIYLGKPAGTRRTVDERRLSEIIKEINVGLKDIGTTEMMWLFPVSGHKVLDNGHMATPTLEEGSGGISSSKTWRKHLLLITYLDLLAKGIRYLLWSIAKARFICHAYLPIEYSKYAKNIPDEANSLGFDIKAGIVEPGSSVRITYDPNNTLFKSVSGPLIPFPIKGLEKDQHIPLVNSITRGTDIIEDTITKKFTIEVSTQAVREMTWYVSKKVTYLGADGAMMRVEMTEGSLDWTLFFNEKNLLTQVSEHYMLNGLGNFRSGLF